MIKEGKYHKCDKCKTPHFSDNDKVSITDPIETYYSVLTCFACGHDTFIEANETVNSRIVKHLLTVIRELKKEVFFSDEHFKDWLNEPNSFLGGDKPKTYLKKPDKLIFLAKRLIWMIHDKIKK